MQVNVDGIVRVPEGARDWSTGQPLPEAGQFFHVLVTHMQGGTSSTAALRQFEFTCVTTGPPRTEDWLAKYAAAQAGDKGGAQ